MGGFGDVKIWGYENLKMWGCEMWDLRWTIYDLVLDIWYLKLVI